MHFQVLEYDFFSTENFNKTTWKQLENAAFSVQNKETKLNFRENNPQTNETLCSICDFPLKPRVKTGWAEDVFKAEYLFLENIYSQR